MHRTIHCAVLAALLVSLGGVASADVLEMADGSKLDGKILKEEGGFVSIKTLAGVKRVAVGDIVNRSLGKGAPEVLADLQAAVEKEPKNVLVLWDLYKFQKEHAADLPKEAAKTLEKVLKLAPDFPDAREENGDVKFEGKWVKKEDLPRLMAEAEVEGRRRKWQALFGVAVTMHEGKHWVFLDNTGDKEAAKHLAEMDDAYEKTASYLGQEHMWQGTQPAVAFKRFEDYVEYVKKSQQSNPMSQAKFDMVQRPDLGGYYRHQPQPLIVRFPTEKGGEDIWNHFAHNASHVVTWMYFRQNPPTWIEEGLACLVEFEVMGAQKSPCLGIPDAQKDKGTSDKRPGKGAKKDSTLDGRNEFKERCVKAVQAGEFPDMRKFLRMKPADYGPAEAGGAMGLVTFLTKRDPEKFRKHCDYVRTPPAKDDTPWQKVWGWNLIEDMEKEWKTFVLTQW
ncbi:MAG: hypothetical protein HMLKMBBP_03149 [Planctomycetes bacterium]|nr:hypothetical protein [Planctomycetota bacterium]